VFARARVQRLLGRGAGSSRETGVGGEAECRRRLRGDARAAGEEIRRREKGVRQEVRQGCLVVFDNFRSPWHDCKHITIQ